MDKWKEIWNKRTYDGEINLEALLRADGFDTGAGSMNIDNWLVFVDEIENKILKEQNYSIFEVGCGSGAFLYPLYLRNYKVAGIDYSEPLINLAKKAMPEMSFSLEEAINIDTQEKYDVSITCSVFQYFQSLDYAKAVLKKMFLKSNKIVALLDISDKQKEEEYHSMRRGSLNEGEYDKKYKNLNHLFYTKDWFKEFAQNNNCNIEIYD